MKTKITELLQIEYPVFQGGMAWVAEHKLAAAVSNAGSIPGLVCGGLRIHTPDKGHHGRSRNITLDCGQLHDL